VNTYEESIHEIDRKPAVGLKEVVASIIDVVGGASVV